MPNLQIPEIIQVKELAQKIDVPVTKVISKLISFGVLANLNQDIDYDTAAIIADEFGIQVSPLISLNPLTSLNSPSLPAGKKGGVGEIKGLEPRPPVITIMGHVDHGKTTLLDTIRTTKVALKEAGGITQHISAYLVRYKNRIVTFIDTPGHSAFEATREHGAAITDLVILVVAADDGVKPQTIEVINHANKVAVPIVVAINKIDKPEADIERTKRQLSELKLVPEEWGGDTIMVPIVATTGEGIDQLLEMIFLSLDLKELKANPNVSASGVIIESHMTQGIGPQSTVLIQNGTLHIGDNFVAGEVTGKIRTILNGELKKVNSIGPGYSGLISGLSGMPQFASELQVVDSDKEAKNISETIKRKQTAKSITSLLEKNSNSTIEVEGEKILFNLIFKAENSGVIEAITKSFKEFENSDVGVNIIAAKIGDISESDITLAKTANASIFGFNINFSNEMKKIASNENINIKIYSIIYEIIEDIEDILKSLMPTIKIENEIARAQVKAIFNNNRKNQIIGVLVKSGELKKMPFKLVSGEKVLAYGKIEHIKQGKNEAEKIKSGSECGLEININKILEPDEKKFEIKEDQELIIYEINEIKKPYKPDTRSQKATIKS